eukprot:jgi/Mesvir1/982/Mv17526-RA.1
MDDDLDDHQLDEHNRRMERLRPTPVVVVPEDVPRRSSTEIAVERNLNAVTSSLVDGPADYVKEMEAYLGLRFSSEASTVVVDLPHTPRLTTIPASSTPPRPHPLRSPARRQFRHSPPDAAEPSLTTLTLQDAARVGAGLGEARNRGGRAENDAAVPPWSDAARFASSELAKEERRGLETEPEGTAQSPVVYPPILGNASRANNGPFDPASQLELRNGTDGCTPAGATNSSFRGPVPPSHFLDRANGSLPGDIIKPAGAVTSDRPQPVPAAATAATAAAAAPSSPAALTANGPPSHSSISTMTVGSNCPSVGESRPDDDTYSYDEDDDEDEDDMDSGVSADDPISEIRRLRQKWRAAVREAEVHGAAATSSYQALREKERLLEMANEKVAEISDGMRRLKEEFRLQRRADTDKLAWAKRLVARTEKARDALETEVATLKGETETREQNLLLLKRRVKAERNRARQLENQLNETQLENERYWSQVQLLRRLLGMCLCITGILALRLFSGPRAVRVNLPLNLDDALD